ncbi:MAG: ErfK/YbiS/YcfS/YnhG family protein, partial [Nocardioides sp.]|nr:ErfK/YbiS/YcfS/YnhG family protein [Nocardioides sp.]
MTRRLLALLLLVSALSLGAAPADAAGRPWVEKAQRALNHLGCEAGPVDGDLGRWTRSAVIRFQSRHHLPQNGRLTQETRHRLYADDAMRCDQRPVPKGSGKGRRIVISQGQNWVWLVGAKGGIAAQGGIVDNPSELRRGGYATGSYCGRA